MQFFDYRTQVKKKKKKKKTFQKGVKTDGERNRLKK
jgi:hypothetical protein